MIKYLGSKRTLLTPITDTIGKLYPKPRSVIDLFSGTSRVGHVCKALDYQVFANDNAHYAHVLAACYVEADDTYMPEVRVLLDELQEAEPWPGWFTEAYGEKARFFTPENAAKIEGIRNRIELRNLPWPLKAIVLTSLMEAADRVDSTVGVQMAYLKQWAPRAKNPVELRMPSLLPQAKNGRGKAYRAEAKAVAMVLAGDVAYLDPPYNQHKYLGNYHVWETLIRWDNPETYGVANKRVDTKDQKSPFNSKRECFSALKEVVSLLDVRHIVLSFSDEGFLTRQEIESMLEEERGNLKVLAFENDRYVGAKIGVYNPQGEKVGTPGKLKNTEFLFVAGK